MKLQELFEWSWETGTLSLDEVRQAVNGISDELRDDLMRDVKWFRDNHPEHTVLRFKAGMTVEEALESEFFQRFHFNYVPLDHLEKIFNE